jgi:hypothetical protein
MEGKPDDRSQPILRVPRDKTPAELTLDDGDQRYVLFYVAPGDKLARLFDESNAFVPVTDGSGTRFVARTAIACVTTHVARVDLDDVLPQERQHAVVKLRGGAVVRGALRWNPPQDRRRTLDHLNDDSRYFLVFEGDYVHFVAKSAVISVEEA